jgi:hypothetical protein
LKFKTLWKSLLIPSFVQHANLLSLDEETLCRTIIHVRNFYWVYYEQRQKLKIITIINCFPSIFRYSLSDEKFR